LNSHSYELSSSLAVVYASVRRIADVLSREPHLTSSAQRGEQFVHLLLGAGCDEGDDRRRL
jgi:hypothetical protein